MRRFSRMRQLSVGLRALKAEEPTKDLDLPTVGDFLEYVGEYLQYEPAEAGSKDDDNAKEPKFPDVEEGKNNDIASALADAKRKYEEEHPLPPDQSERIEAAKASVKAFVAKQPTFEQLTALRSRLSEELAELVLPCRQDLEECDHHMGRPAADAGSAYLTVDEFMELNHSTMPAGDGLKDDDWRECYALPIVCVSYAWETQDHPDPFGKTLIKVADALEGSAMSEAVGQVGVFFDWCSLPQNKAWKSRPEAQGRPHGHRTAEEDAAFKDALGSMQVWYAHMLTTVFLMTAPIENAPKTCLPYDARGWPTFERLVSMICKPRSENVWPLIQDVALGTGDCERLVPLTPEGFNREIEKKTFTNGSDAGHVMDLYKNTLDHVLSRLKQLKMRESCHWGDADMATLVKLLPMCKEACFLDLTNSFGELSVMGLTILIDALKKESLPSNIREIMFGYAAVDRQGWLMPRPPADAERSKRSAEAAIQEFCMVCEAAPGPITCTLVHDAWTLAQGNGLSA